MCDQRKVCSTSELPLPRELVGSRPRALALCSRCARTHGPRRTTSRKRKRQRRFFASSVCLPPSLSLSFSFTVPATIQPGRGSITARRRCETQRTWKTKDRTRQTRHAVGSVVAPRARVYGFEREVSVRRLTFTARQLIPREGLRVSRGGVDSLALCQHAPGRQEARSRAQRHTHVAARANE